MKRTCIIIFLLLIEFVATGTPIRFFKSYDAAVQMAQKRNTDIMIVFGTQW